MIPMAMARKIHSARKRSRRARLLNTESVGDEVVSFELGFSCCSRSRTVEFGGGWEERECSLLSGGGVCEVCGGEDII
jgi:hypothetical protein